MHFGFNNPYNYVRVSELQLVSIEMLAICVALLYLAFLAWKKELNWEIAYFLAIPFSDEPFRVASVQPVEIISLIIIALNYRKIRLNYVILMAAVFISFCLPAYITGDVTTSYPLLYSLRFLLTGLTFSIFLKKEFGLSVSVMRFAIGFTFAMTFLQVALWTLGLPIHGIFFNGIFPRAKGLAHEPGTWSIWIVVLFVFIYHFKLGRFYFWLNALTLLMTLSTFGFVAALSFLLIYWAMRGFPIPLRKSTLQRIGIMGGLVVVVAAVQPNALSSASNLLTAFDKLAYYQQEFTRFASGGSAQEGEENGDLSGRGRDFTYFQNYFPEHWLGGIGSWNTDPSVNGAGTNTYLIMPVEIGVLGSSLIVLLMVLQFCVLLRDRDRKSTAFLAGSLNFLLMIGGIRCFAFHELWYVQANTLRLPQEDLSLGAASQENAVLESQDALVSPA